MSKIKMYYRTHETDGGSWTVEHREWWQWKWRKVPWCQYHSSEWGAKRQMEYEKNPPLLTEKLIVL